MHVFQFQLTIYIFWSFRVTTIQRQITLLHLFDLVNILVSTSKVFFETISYDNINIYIKTILITVSLNDLKTVGMKHIF